MADGRYGNSEVPASRGVRVRARTGCMTCRIRRVKCGEEKPDCLRCRNSGRVCDGYGTTALSRNDLALAVRSGMSLNGIRVGYGGFANERERQSFEFFRCKTGTESTGLSDKSAWRRTALQLSYTEPAIKYGVIALGLLHQRFELDDASSQSERTITALGNYSKAARQTRELVSRNDRDSRDKVLLACLLFICIENVLGNYGSAQMHLRNGMRILRQDHNAWTSNTRALGESLHRFDFQAMAFNDGRFPYPYEEAGLSSSDTTMALPAQFTSLERASVCLLDIMRRMFIVGGALRPSVTNAGPRADSTPARAEVDVNLKLWISKFDALAQSLTPMNSHDINRSLLMRVYHTIATVILRAGFGRTETVWDAYLPDFQRMLDLMEVLARAPSLSNRSSAKHFSLEIGVIMPLFFTALKCRDPQSRRRALAILSCFRRQEGIWDSTNAARVAERIMVIEEEGIEGVTAMEQIPECARLCSVSIETQLQHRRIRIRCVLAGTKQVREEWIAI